VIICERFSCGALGNYPGPNWESLEGDDWIQLASAVPADVSPKEKWKLSPHESCTEEFAAKVRRGQKHITQVTCRQK
jgi:hypothetical protein